jgi:general secretion pathway protein G
MIALAILSLVIGAVAFTGFNQLKKSQMKTTRNTMHNIESALVQWQADTGETCPSSLNDLAAKKILNKAPADGWGKPFRFKCPGEHNNEIDLVSNGPDGKAETEDDVRSWEDEKKKE